MQHFASSSRLLLVLFATLAASSATALAETAPMRATAPAPAAQAPKPAPAAPLSGGKVLETMDASSYTYARVQTKDGETWVAGPKTTVKVGDELHWRGGSEMKNFPSKSLNRTFESILFVDAFVGAGAAAQPQQGASPHPNVGAPHGAVSGGAAGEAAEVSGIEKAEGGVTVAEVYDKRDQLDGKDVVIRGKVVKFNGGVMNTNWLHLRDGSKGKQGENDLTITTKGSAAVGDVVVVKGKVARNRDFGFGYRYDVMLEDATIEGH